METVFEVFWMSVAAAGSVYVVSLIASKAFFQAKYDYHKKLANALIKGDREL